MHVNIKKAKPEDTTVVSSILSEAAQYLESIEQPMWKCDEIKPENVSKDVLAGQYYIAECNGEPVGTFKYQLEDRLFWPDITDDKSAFIHRIAVIRRVASKGVSSQMLEWAKLHTKTLDRNYLRLDCEIRPRLCKFYEGNGFIKHSERQVGPYYVVRYECNVMN